MTAAASASFDALVTAYRRRLNRYALHLLKNREDAEEAVQDAFMRAYRDLEKQGTTVPDNTRTKAWLFKITLNVVRNRLRRKRLTQIVFDESNHSECWESALVDRIATFALVERAICALPFHLLESARLRYIEGLTPTQIARRCSLPVGTVKSHVCRARRLLREVLQPTLRAA